jgi:hypothetical protein
MAQLVRARKPGKRAHCYTNGFPVVKSIGGVGQFRGGRLEAVVSSAGKRDMRGSGIDE